MSTKNKFKLHYWRNLSLAFLTALSFSQITKATEEPYKLTGAILHNAQLGVSVPIKVEEWREMLQPGIRLFNELPSGSTQSPEERTAIILCASGAIASRASNVDGPSVSTKMRLRLKLMATAASLYGCCIYVKQTAQREALKTDIDQASRLSYTESKFLDASPEILSGSLASLDVVITELSLVNYIDIKKLTHVN